MITPSLLISKPLKSLFSSDLLVSLICIPSRLIVTVEVIESSVELISTSLNSFYSIGQFKNLICSFVTL